MITLEESPTPHSELYDAAVTSLLDLAQRLGTDGKAGKVASVFSQMAMTAFHLQTAAPEFTDLQTANRSLTLAIVKLAAAAAS